MAEYVDKEELLRCLEKKIKACNEYRMAVVDTDFIDLVNDATVIEDVVEVVRCKDCKFWSAMDNGFSFHNRGRADGECEMLLERHYSERHLTGGEHFCSYGERKAGIEKGAVNGSEEVPGENQEN